jgi:Mg-chelatase subunit ChlD
MQFTTPLALLLLLTLPLFAWLGWPARGYGRGREISALVLRLLIALLLIFALAGLEIVQKTEKLAVVFLIDQSDSMPLEAQISAFGYVEDALANMQVDDQAAVVVFGGDALVERPMSSAKTLGTLTSIPNTSQTDLAEAIQLGLALYPPDAAKRMVVLTDGTLTTGDATRAARLAASSGVEFVFVPFTYQRGADVALTSVQAPERLLQGENFDLRLTVEASQATETQIRVFAGDTLVYDDLQTLDGGTQSFSLPLVAGEPGFTNFEVQLSPLDDTLYQNNELSAYTQVEGPPKVLLVAPPAGEPMLRGDELRPDEYSNLLNTFRAAGFTVDAVRPTGLPSELALMAEYASIVLVDVPARDLSNRQMETLQSYVRDLGGGLLTVGGPTSYGVGGYFRTPLEETLPIDMQIKDEQRRPTLTMVFIIDKSGSMSGVNGASKLDLAKEAAARSVELMFPTDRVGVIAFDDQASWVVKITDLSDPDYVVGQIGSIRDGGGTDILAGLNAMAQVLPDDPASVKHVILLTDGGADATGIPQLVERLYTEDGITLTTVGVGSDAAPFLQDLAVIGNGRYHFTDSPNSIPSIFTEETTLATRSYIIEESFYPKGLDPSPIIAGIETVPPLHGYVGTSAKDTARTILISDKGDPILASWQYGLGKAVAFTSDASPRWARDWVGWSEFSTFWAQALRFTLADDQLDALSVNVDYEGESARVIVDARTDSGLYLNNYEMRANVIAPDGTVEQVTLMQIAPGRYAAEFVPSEEGAYLLRVDGTSAEDGDAVSLVDGWVLAYSPEYRNLRPDPDQLNRLAAQLNAEAPEGKEIASFAPEHPGLIFTHDFDAARRSSPIWPLLLTLAALLLPVDIAIRRLAISRRDVTRALTTLRGRFQREPIVTPTAPTTPRTQRIGSLMKAKERTEDSRVQETPAQIRPPKPTPTRPPHADAPPETKQVPPTRPTSPPTDQKQKTQSTSTASQLLKRKREIQHRRSSPEDDN